MSRNRVIYQSEALFASKEHTSTASADHEQLHRVQSANYGFSVSRQDVNQFGNLARIDSIILEAPTVNFDVTYYPTNGFNEKVLDFFVRDANTGPTISGQFASGHLAAGSGKNFYILTVPEGRDANLNRQNGSTDNSIIGIGNAFLTDYTLDLSVGSLPTANVSFEASNIVADTAVSGDTTVFSGINSPGVDPELGESLGFEATIPVASGNAADTDADLVSALRPGDITVDVSSFNGDTLSNLLGNNEGIHVQSASLSIPLSRSPIERLGSKFPFARVVDFPVNATLSVNAIVNTLEAQNLANVISGCGETNRRDVSLTLKECGVNKTGMHFLLKGCTVDSESFSSSIGSNKSVDITFSTQIGGTRDANNGIFVSGNSTTVPYV